MSVIDTKAFIEGPPISMAPTSKRTHFLKQIADLRRFSEDHMLNTRAKSMVLTKLDEARMWANEIEDHYPPQ